MYGVTSDLKLDMFQGTTLDHVTVARHVIAFHFESGSSLSVEGDWELVGPGGEVVDRSLDPDRSNADHGPLRVHACIGRRVVAARTEPPRSIALEFEGGLVLRVFDRDSRQYESFHIQPGDIHV